MTDQKIVDIDARGMKCPRPIIELAKVRRKVSAGTIIHIIADDLAFESDVRAWCETAGNKLIDVQKIGKITEARIEILQGKFGGANE